MESKPVTVTFLVGGLLWALWHWRRTRLAAAAAPAPGPAVGTAPFDAGARLAAVTP